MQNINKDSRSFAISSNGLPGFLKYWVNFDTLVNDLKAKGKLEEALWGQLINIAQLVDTLDQMETSAQKEDYAKENAPGLYNAALDEMQK